MNFSAQTFRMAILRRDVDETQDRGDVFREVFSRMASIRQTRGKELVEAGLDEGAGLMIVMVRDGTAARTITVADRARIRDDDFAIVNVNQPDRLTGSIEIALSQRVGS